MPGVEEIKLHLAASIDDIEQSVAGIRSVIERLEEALTRLRVTTTGSRHPRAEEAIARVHEARQRLDEAQMLALGGIQAAQAYHASI